MQYVINIPDDGSSPSIYQLTDRCQPTCKALADGMSRAGFGDKLKADAGIFGFLRRFLEALPQLEVEEDAMVV